MLPYVAVHCSVLHCVAMCCCVLRALFLSFFLWGENPRLKHVDPRPYHRAFWGTKNKKNGCVLRNKDDGCYSRRDSQGLPGWIKSPPCPWDTHYQFWIKTLLSNARDIITAGFYLKEEKKLRLTFSSLMSSLARSGVVCRNSRHISSCYNLHKNRKCEWCARLQHTITNCTLQHTATHCNTVYIQNTSPCYKLHKNGKYEETHIWRILGVGDA